MKKALVLLSVLLLAFAAGCAAGANAPLLKKTATGRPEAVFAGEKVAKVKDKVMVEMATKTWMLTDSGDNFLLFSKPLDGGAELFAQMAWGVNTSGTYFARYVFAQQEKNTFATVHLYSEIIKPFGKQLITMNNNAGINSFQQQLFDLGGQ